jgi:hypothetical protein
MENHAYLYNFAEDADWNTIRVLLEKEGFDLSVVKRIFIHPSHFFARIFFKHEQDAARFIQHINERKISGRRNLYLTAAADHHAAGATKKRDRSPDPPRRVVMTRTEAPPQLLPPPAPVVHGPYLNAEGMVVMSQPMFQQYHQAWTALKQLLQIAGPVSPPVPPPPGLY